MEGFQYNQVMEILMIVIAVAFVALLVIGAMHFFQEGPPGAPGKADVARKTAGPKRDGKADFITILQKKVAVGEEKIKNLEGEFQVQRLESARAQERAKKLEGELASMAHDAQSYQKFQKEHVVLKEEMKKKERLLEEEISRRRRETTHLANAKSDLDDLKRQLTQAQDIFRKTQALYERTTAELRETRAALDKHIKTAQEQSGQKTQGGWIAREEFEKVEREIEEKEAFIKKLLALQQQSPPPAGGTR